MPNTLSFSHLKKSGPLPKRMKQPIARFFFAALLFLPNLLFSQTIDIATARQTPLGSEVTVRGIVTSGAELGRIRYLQDATAGIGAFPGTGSAPDFESNVTTGDLLEVTGKLVDFNGLLEISPITAYTVVSSGNPLPDPKPVTGLALLSEDLEGQLVRLECITFNTSFSTFAISKTYTVNDPDGGESVIFLRNTSPIIGDSVPTGSVQLTAVLSQYNDYQLLPRTKDDIVEQQSCFHIVQRPDQTNLQTDGFTVSWSTNLPSFSVLKYGTSPDNLIYETQSPSSGTAHTVNLSGLQPGTIYWTQALATHNAETAASDIVPMATRSLSTNQIQVWFNHAAPGPEIPDGDSFDEVLAATLDRIQQANRTIDVAMYNNNRTDITNALVAAHNRGVRVRYVASQEGSSPALMPPPPFPVVYGNDNNLMHNKFMVIDADETHASWVMGGSMNWTTTNMKEDFNNTLFIRDQSLARTYELEFNEMWGSAGPQPDASKARFGGAKKDDTPHRFIIGGIPVECYFSPSDQTNTQINRVLQSAEDDLFFSLLTFTRDDLAQTIVERHNAGVTCRGIIDNWNDNGSEYLFLLNNGMPVVGDTRPETVHHKYGVADATLPTSDPTVVTGSHNWSNAADTGNDENTLVIHDAAIARMYRQEFDYWIDKQSSTQTIDDQRFEVFPNPAATSIAILAGHKITGKTRVEVLDSAGKIHLVRQFASGEGLLLPVESLPDGLYFAKILTENGRFAAVPFQKIRR